MSKRLRKRFKMPEITLTPLIDTALTLLVIFIVTAPMVQHGIQVDLPQGKSKEVGTEQEFIVTINKHGTLYFNSFPLTRNELVPAIQKALVGREEAPIYIKADENINYGKVIEVVDELKMAGVKLVAMSTRAAA